MLKRENGPSFIYLLLSGIIAWASLSFADNVKVQAAGAVVAFVILLWTAGKFLILIIQTQARAQLSTNPTKLETEKIDAKSTLARMLKELNADQLTAFNQQVLSIEVVPLDNGPALYLRDGETRLAVRFLFEFIRNGNGNLLPPVRSYSEGELWRDADGFMYSRREQARLWIKWLCDRGFASQANSNERALLTAPEQLMHRFGVTDWSQL